MKMPQNATQSATGYEGADDNAVHAEDGEAAESTLHHDHHHDHHQIALDRGARELGKFGEEQMFAFIPQ